MPLVELPGDVLVEEGRNVAALGQPAFLEPEDEDGLVPARTGAEEVDHVDAAGLVCRREPHRSAFERRDQLVRRQLLTEPLPALELVQDPRRRLVRAQVETRPLADGRRLQPVGRPRHRPGQRADGVDRGRGSAEELERRQRMPVAQANGLLLDTFTGLDGAAAQPALEVVDVIAPEARVARAQEPVEIAAVAVLPLEPQQREKRAAVWRLVEPQAPLERERDPQRPQDRLERRAPAVEGRDDDRNLLRRGAAAGFNVLQPFL